MVHAHLLVTDGCISVLDDYSGQAIAVREANGSRHHGAQSRAPWNTSNIAEILFWRFKESSPLRLRHAESQ